MSLMGMLALAAIITALAYRKVDRNDASTVSYLIGIILSFFAYFLTVLVVVTLIRMLAFDYTIKSIAGLLFF